MDPTRFDQLARSLAQPASRRRTLGVLVGGALATLAGVSGSDAKRRHGHRHPGPADNQCKPSGSLPQSKCTKNAQCCSGTCAQGNCCTPDAKTTTCAGKCGTVKNNCGLPVDCTAVCAGCCANDACVAYQGQTPASCGTGGAACASCPGYMQPNDNVTCQSGKCTFSCQGEHYDVNDDKSDGCEAADAVTGNHIQQNAVSLGRQGCTDTLLGPFSGTIYSDRRVHEIPAIVGFDSTTGSAPDWFTIHADGGTFCQDDLNVTLTVTGSSRPDCYKLSVLTNKGTFTAQVGTDGTANITQGSGSYSDDTDIFFRVEKTCGTSVVEAADYSLQFHL